MKLINIFNKIFFFFQAEDGIRDGHVTGVQTCALVHILIRLKDSKAMMFSGSYSVAPWRMILRWTLKSILISGYFSRHSSFVSLPSFCWVRYNLPYPKGSAAYFCVVCNMSSKCSTMFFSISVSIFFMSSKLSNTICDDCSCERASTVTSDLNVSLSLLINFDFVCPLRIRIDPCT